MTRRRAAIAIGVVVALSTIASAHDDNVTHSRITESALALIEEAARTSGNVRELYAYAELSTNDRAYWGRDRRYTEQQDSDLGAREYINSGLSVVNGAVLEDAPFTRVGSHFRNAYTGERSLVAEELGDPFDSAIVGHRYFDQAIEVFGYQTESTTRIVTMTDPDPLGVGAEITFPQSVPAAKELGFFLLGHALHHVEDTSSIAHAHNDLHLTLGILDPILAFVTSLDEKDDYEASTLPTLLWDLNGGNNRFGAETSNLAASLPTPGDVTALRPASVTDFTDIWAAPAQGGDLVLGPNDELINAAAGLGRSVYNLSVMQGELGDVPLLLANTCAENLATGEISETFNRDGNLGCTIFHDFEMIPSNASWCIEGEDMFLDDGTGTGTQVLSSVPGIGCWAQYIYIVQAGVRRTAGPLPGLIADKIEESLEGFWPTSRAGGPSPAGGGDYFYIEQLMEGIASGDDFNQRLVVRPPGRRETFDRRYRPVNNPVVANATDPIEGSFGANQPLSLVEEYIMRLLPLSVEYVAGFSQLWYDIVNLPPYLKKVRVEQDSQDEPLRYEAEWIDQTRVREFVFINESIAKEKTQPFNYVYERNLVVPVLRHIDPSEPFKMIIEFNEPVNEPDPDPAELGIEIRLNGTLLTPSDVVVTPPPLQDPWLENREWELEFASLASAFPGGLPEGEVQLTVQAWDRNFHRNNSTGAREYGAMLDQQPGTPARRQRIRPDEARRDQTTDLPNVDGPWGTPAWIDYPWHDDMSVDISFPEMEAGDFEYDQDGPGDDSHVLLLDDTPPEASFGVQTP